MTPKKIWAMLDERQGNTSQTIGVAEALGLPFETKQIAFNAFIRLPNPLVNHNLLGIAKESRALLTPPWPDMVISCARRLALVATYIKTQNPKTFLAQIQWPGYPHAQFDLIATPLHDNIALKANILHTLGAPHRVTDAMLSREAALWQSALQAYKAPRIALLVGGGRSAASFAERHGEKLAQLSLQLAQKSGGSLLVTTSRRTGKPMTDILAARLKENNFIYAWEDQRGEKNPFYGFLGIADAIITTGDSMSMCSEACATGKPVFIYHDEDFTSRKHQQFLREIFVRKLAEPLDETSALYTPTQQFNDTPLIAREIRKRAKL